jgi:guanylate kinase
MLIGTEILKNTLKDIKIVTIFLRVPKEELRHRLENRIDKPSEGEIILRLNRFDYEESKIGMYDYVLKNDNLEKAVSIIEEIIRQESKEEN